MYKQNDVLKIDDDGIERIIVLLKVRKKDGYFDKYINDNNYTLYKGLLGFYGMWYGNNKFSKKSYGKVCFNFEEYNPIKIGTLFKAIKQKEVIKIWIPFFIGKKKVPKKCIQDT